MANPLTTSAAEVVPVNPPTRFFDPGESLGIMQRYGMSAANRAFAEDALKSANEIDEAANYDPVDRRNQLDEYERKKKVYDREDAQYQDKKAFENTLGTFLVDMASIKEDDEDFDVKTAKLLANPAAAEHEAVKAVYNLKVQNRANMQREKLQQQEYDRRFGDEIVQMTGAKPEDIYDEKGNLARDKVATIITGRNQAKLQGEAADKQRETLQDAIGKKDAYLLDRSREEVDKEFLGRTTGLVDAAKHQGIEVPDAKALGGIFEANPNISRAAFVAQTLDLGKRLPIKEGADKDDIIMAMLENKAELPAELKPLVDAAEDVWSAGFARRNTAPSKKAPAEPQQKPKNPGVNRYFE
jgi:hypothetical protein